MRIIQFQLPDKGRRIGVIAEDQVCDITSVRPEWKRVADAFEAAADTPLPELLEECLNSAQRELSYPDLLKADRTTNGPFLLPPLDLEEPRRVLITGTGLTHLGSMQSRDDMHSTGQVVEMTDSRRMFEMGLQGGKPEAGKRGAQPEWFYKGTGSNLRAHGDALTIPSFAQDGGEEAELVGCYIVDSEGVPRRLGFALGNEWSDHETERVNYLYLAPSKLRTCAVGPELITDCDFQEIQLQCRVLRQGQIIYESGPMLSGEQHMCHSLANCEDHHFKYAQHRQPGDVHLHFFGTSKLSYGSRDWKYADADQIEIEAPGFSAPLVNPVRRETESLTPVAIKPG